VQGVDVGHHPLQQLAAAEAGTGQPRQQAPVDLAAEAAQQPQHGVVRGQPLAIAPGSAEDGAQPDQGAGAEDVELGGRRGAQAGQRRGADEPAGQRQQPQRRQQRHQPQRQAQTEAQSPAPQLPPETDQRPATLAHAPSSSSRNSRHSLLSARASSDCGAPCSTSRPCSSTSTRSTHSRWARSWVASKTLRPWLARASSARKAALVSASSCAVGSSSSHSGASRSSARSSASRCSWPPDSPRPPSPSTVSRPSGRLASSPPNPACRSTVASAVSSYPSAPRVRFSRRLPRNHSGRCPIQASTRHQLARSSVVKLRPLARILPSLGAAKPSTRLSRLDLPAPLSPTSATRSPGFRTKETASMPIRPSG